MSKRGGGQGLPDVEFPADAEYVALVRLEKPGGFVEPGEVVRLERARATVLLAAGLVTEASREGAKDAKAADEGEGGHVGPPLPPDVGDAEIAEE